MDGFKSSVCAKQIYFSFLSMMDIQVFFCIRALKNNIALSIEIPLNQIVHSICSFLFYIDTKNYLPKAY